MQGINKLTDILFPPANQTLPTDQKTSNKITNVHTASQEDSGLSGVQNYASDFSVSSDKNSNLSITTAKEDIVNISFSDISFSDIKND
jgi:hypothetical protein